MAFGCALTADVAPTAGVAMPGALPRGAGAHARPAAVDKAKSAILLKRRSLARGSAPGPRAKTRLVRLSEGAARSGHCQQPGAQLPLARQASQPLVTAL